MAIFQITEGAPGQGKSLYTASVVEELCYRNKKWHEKGYPIRKIVSNIKFSESFESEWKDYILYWTDTAEIVKMRDCDIIWDEIATELDARNFANLSVELKRFLSQYRKRGIDIYANTQDFSMIDARARLMINSVRTLTKICGSRDISATKPPPKHIWGVVIIRDVLNYREINPEKKEYDPFFSWLIISRSLVDIYDTTQDIALGDPPPLHHEVRYCNHVHKDGEACGFKKIIHS